MPKKVKPKLNTYTIIMDAVASGIQGGLNKHEKYWDEKYDRDSLMHYLDLYITNALCEVIDFDDEV
uniref:Uncharacterized protein n=1 Tax=viral metagenome TaxID=1070528 RepID=A0A6M3JZU7_9ZZZZ